jgi:hypothetical protein
LKLEVFADCPEMALVRKYYQKGKITQIEFLLRRSGTGLPVALVKSGRLVGWR